MKETNGQLVFRKLKTTLLTLSISSIIWSLGSLFLDAEDGVNHTEAFVGMVLFYFIYAGFIVLLIGNIVSLATERMMAKWSLQSSVYYILVLGLAGSTIGFVFPYPSFVVFGAGTAIIYASIDRWLLLKGNAAKQYKIVLGATCMIFLAISIFLYFSSSQIHLFTAVEL